MRQDLAHGQRALVEPTELTYGSLIFQKWPGVCFPEELPGQCFDSDCNHYTFF